MSLSRSPAALLCLALFLGACNLDTRYFEDYAGVNLIANRGFGPEWATTAAAPVMAWSEQDPSGGPEGSPAWRLEILNLFPNGDFEAGVDPFWRTQNFANPGALRAAVTRITADNLLPPPAPSFDGWRLINGPGLRVVTEITGDQVYFDLDEVLADAGMPAERRPGEYRLHFDFRTYRNLLLQYYVLGSGSPENLFTSFDQVQELFFAPVEDETTSVDDATYANRARVPGGSDNGNLQNFLVDGAAGTRRILSFGFHSSRPQDTPQQNTMIDNVKLVRVSDPLFVELALPSLNSGALRFWPGIYEFEIWVKDELPAALTPAVPNAYPAEALTLELQAQGSAKSGLERRVFNRPETGWTDWTRLSVKGSFDLVAQDSQLPEGVPVFSLRISPSAQGLQDRFVLPGRLLVSRPRLEFFER